MKKSKARLFLSLLTLGSFFVCVAPLAVCFILNWGEYTAAPGGAVKLCVGGAICAFLIFLAVLGKLKVPGRLVTAAVLFAVAYLLEVLLADLVLLLGLNLLGIILDTVLFLPPMRALRQRLLIDKTADATAKRVEEVISEYVRRA